MNKKMKEKDEYRTGHINISPKTQQKSPIQHRCNNSYT